MFHPNSTHRQFLSDVLNGFAEAGITLKRVEPEEFQQAIDRMMDNPDLVTLLRPLMAYNLGGNRKRFAVLSQPKTIPRRCSTVAASSGHPPPPTMYTVS